MTIKKIIHTDKAPQAIGCYSQAIKIGNTVYLSGQIGIDPLTMQLVNGIENQTHQVFKNLNEVITESGGNFSNIVKLNIYIIDMADFVIINQIIEEYFIKPYPARAVIGVKELPKGGLIEADGILVL